MYIFKDSQECKIDTKGRLLLPSIYRKGLGSDVDKGFFLKKAIYTNSLELYISDRWDLELQKYDDYDNDEELHIDVRRAILSLGQSVELDTIGRILIPKDMLQHAKIEGDVKLAAARDYLEIWNATLFNEHVAQTMKNIQESIKEVKRQIKLNKQ